MSARPDEAANASSQVVSSVKYWLPRNGGKISMDREGKPIPLRDLCDKQAQIRRYSDMYPGFIVAFG